MALLRGFVGRAGHEEPAFLPDDELIGIVRAELRELLGIQAAPRLARVYRWPRALPQYTLGHPARLQQIDALAEALPGLALVGSAYRGVGIPDIIRDATERAAALAAALMARVALPSMR